MPTTREYRPYAPWAEFHTQRQFCLTADQDWAPEWAMRVFLDWVRERSVPVHVFVTSTSETLDIAQRSGHATVGWHPNFGRGSTHGDTPDEVIAHLRGIAPAATTFRSHGFTESFQALTAMAAAGHRTESQFPTDFSAGITPQVHASGLIRMPVWFEDDIWMRDPVRADTRVAATLPTPGLKILNLHPIHIALNSPDFAYYDSRRAEIYGAEADGHLSFDGRGARTVAEELIDAGNGSEGFVEFEELADRAQELRAALR